MKKLMMGSLLLGALLAVGSATAEAKTVTVKMATLAPGGSAWDNMLKQMGGTWQKATEGRVELKIYPGGVAGDDPDVVRKMRIGQLQGAALTVSGLTQIDDAFNVLAIPLFFEDMAEYLYVREKMTPALSKVLEDRGFKLLHWGHGGWIHLFATKTAANVAELQTLKMFTWAGDDRMAESWKQTGFTPVPLASTDIMTGLQTGLIEAMPTTPYAALALQWFRLAPYMLDMGFAPLIGATVVSSKTWDKISPEDQAALTSGGIAADDALSLEIQAGDDAAVEEMKKRGLELIPVNPADKEWANTALAFAEQMQKKQVPPAMYELALKYRTEYRAAHGGSR